MIQLSEKDRAFRIEALNGRLWPLIAHICIPLAIFQAIGHLFNILDTLMASHISARAVSTIAYLIQIRNMLNAVGAGFAVGASIIIGRSYGKGDYAKVKECIATSLTLIFLISLVILASLPFTHQILAFLKTPEAFIETGKSYFIVIILSEILNFFNVIYIAIERSRGNSKRILILNSLIVIVKLSLTALFIYVMDGDIIMIAMATLISYALMCIIAIINLVRGSDAFTFSIHSIRLNKETLLPLFSLSMPAMVEKAAFAFGKASINQMATFYGENTVGAAGISNNISSLTTGPQGGFQDGGVTLVSQNEGGGRKDRVKEVFKRLLIIQLTIGLIGGCITLAFLPFISSVFAHSKGAYNPEFHALIIMISRYEVIGCMLLSLSYASLSLLIGLGKTRLSLILNFARVFIFRLPVLYFFEHFTHTGPEAVGYVMCISNSLTGVLSLSLALWQIGRLSR